MIEGRLEHNNDEWEIHRNGEVASVGAELAHLEGRLVRVFRTTEMTGNEVVIVVTCDGAGEK